MTTYALDSNVIISHLSEDRFVEQTDRFFRRAIEKRNRLVLSDVVYAELYTGVYLSAEEKEEERHLQKFLAANDIEVRPSRSLKIARRAGELYARHLGIGNGRDQRILPDFLIAAQAEATCEALVTWNSADYEHLGLKIKVLAPSRA